MFREEENMQKENLREKHEDTLNSKHWIATCLMKNNNSITLEKCLEK